MVKAVFSPLPQVPGGVKRPSNVFVEFFNSVVEV